MRFPLPLPAPLSACLVALLLVCAPAPLAAQVLGDYALTLSPTRLVETDDDMFVDISVTANATNDDGGDGFIPRILCLSVAVSYSGGTASEADAWLASGSSTADRASVLTMVVETDRDGGGSRVFRGLVLAGDDLVEEPEFFDLLVGGITSVGLEEPCDPPVLPVPRPVRTFPFTITDDDDGDEPAVEGEYTVTFTPTTFAETDSDDFVDVSVDVAVTGTADAPGGYVPGVLCYAVRVSFTGATASAADVWLAGGSSPADRVSVLTMAVEVDRGGSGAALFNGLVVAGDNLVEQTEFFDLEFGGVPARVPLGQACGEPSASSPPPVRRQRFMISDDDSAQDPLTPGPVITLLESDDDYVPIVSMQLPVASEGVTCLPYVVSFTGGSASELDLMVVVALDDFTPRLSGWFLFADAAVVGVTENLLVVGDDLVEGDEDPDPPLLRAAVCR